MFNPADFGFDDDEDLSPNNSSQPGEATGQSGNESFENLRKQATAPLPGSAPPPGSAPQPGLFGGSPFADESLNPGSYQKNPSSGGQSNILDDDENMGEDLGSTNSSSTPRCKYCPYL